MTRLQHLRFGAAMWRAGWRRRGGRWVKDVPAHVPDPKSLLSVVGRVNDATWLGAAPGMVQVLRVDGRRHPPGWMLTFVVGETPDVPEGATAAEVYGTADFLRWLGT